MKLSFLPPLVISKLGLWLWPPLTQSCAEMPWSNIKTQMLTWLFMYDNKYTLSAAAVCEVERVFFFSFFFRFVVMSDLHRIRLCWDILCQVAWPDITQLNATHMFRLYYMWRKIPWEAVRSRWFLQVENICTVIFYTSQNWKVYKTLTWI